MKRLILLPASILISLLLVSCSGIPSGYISREEHFQQGGFQDYTDYAKYVYDSMSAFENNSDYKPVLESDAAVIKGYTQDFKSWMSAADRLNEYDFDDSCITVGDFYRLLIKYKNDVYSNYTLWFFDSETATLYYFHNNT
ncbi:MAG: hypothetical protein K6G89_05340 [Clostridia bacterium]|nr:hypothetical protein [Clostridia bacterium]